MGAGRGVLPEAVPRPGRGQQRTQARQDQHHGDHDSQRRWLVTIVGCSSGGAIGPLNLQRKINTNEREISVT